MLEIADMTAYTAAEASPDLRNVLQTSQKVFLMIRSILQLDSIDFGDPRNVQVFSRRKCHALEANIVDFHWHCDKVHVAVMTYAAEISKVAQNCALSIFF